MLTRPGLNDTNHPILRIIGDLSQVKRRPSPDMDDDRFSFFLVFLLLYLSLCVPPEAGEEAAEK